MADVTENGLRAVVKALTDVIAPAIDPADPLAREQLRLAVDYIEFTRARLDWLPDRDRFELAHIARLARHVQDGAAAAGAEAHARGLRAGITAADTLGARPDARMPELKDAAAQLGAVVREALRASAQWPAELRARVERAVVDASDERIAFERAWYLPLGLDPAPGTVAPLASTLRQVHGAAPGP